MPNNHSKKLDFYVRLTTKDGCLVQNRQTDKSFYWNSNVRKWDKEFINISLKRDCCEKGVELISYTVNDNGIEGVVKWC